MAALILLLPDKNINKVDPSKLDSINIPFQIYPDKTTLTCKMHKESGQVQLIEIDSVNQIFWRGDVRNVSFEFLVEDLTQRLRVSLNKQNSNTKLFKIIESIPEQNVKFVWSPGNADYLNKTYLVKVIAKAISNKTNTPLIVKSQFSLNIFFDDEVPQFALQNDNQNNPFAMNPNGMQNGQIPQLQTTGNVDMLQEEFVIKSIAYMNWQNVIKVNNLNLLTGLMKEPVIRVQTNNGGNAKIKEIKENMLVIGGAAPASGDMRVTVTITSKFDKKESSTEFIVKSNSIAHPFYDRVMNPFKTYRIIPNFPDKLSYRVKTLLRDNNKEILTQSMGNSELYYTPNSADTGKTFYIERYLENELIGERYPINLKAYPAPEILSVVRDKKNENILIVKTRSFGFAASRGKKGFENNYVKTIYVSERAEVKERYGDASTNDDKDVFYQTFEVKLNLSNTLKIQAIDTRNIVSAGVFYP